MSLIPKYDNATNGQDRKVTSLYQVIKKLGFFVRHRKQQSISLLTNYNNLLQPGIERKPAHHLFKNIYV
jgi:hypothetical protein